MVRALVVWACLRLAALLLPSSEGGDLVWQQVAFRIALPAALVLYDARRLGEALFLANLGVGQRTLLLIALLPPTFGEILVDGLLR
jgi:hypothetical protein